MSDSATRPNADEEWENLLRQWRTRPEVQPRPYFYNRLRARLVSETAVERLPVRTWLRWPTYAVMLGILLLLGGDGTALRLVGSANQDSASRPESSLGDK